MKERPVIFNGEMVRAIINGRKTQTRRLMAVQPESNQFGLLRISDSTKRSDIGKYHWAESNATGTHQRSALFSCPFGQVGDRLWVRETFADVNTDGGPAFTYRADHGLKFCLDDESPVDYDRYPGKNFAMWCSDLWNGEDGHSWSPSIHMPRWASRITLEITAVRVERLNDISEEDASAEGVAPSQHIITPPEALYRVGFLKLWQSIYGEESWHANPWVWVIEFCRLEVRDASK
ncbi:hypothetical protein ACN6UB_25950 [Serratia marcescens]|uniref:hypothetical protein n=1 Tax=Serratia marcescens TaxID=615 RepID=UPI003AFB14B6